MSLEGTEEYPPERHPTISDTAEINFSVPCLYSPTRTSPLSDPPKLKLLKRN